MQNFPAKLALYSDPETVLEVMQELKAGVTDETRQKLLDVLGGITDRDLLFYALGRSVGHRRAAAEVDAMLAPALALLEKQRVELPDRRGERA